MKDLIHEIHRRSLWQVLAIYVGTSWLILSAVDTLAGVLGLPDWSASFAFFLLIIGLPIVLGTAFVQEGMTTKDPEPPPPMPAESSVEPPPAPEPGGHHRLFTWRHALLGGVAAFALLGVLTAGYLFMRSAGIGPVATLVAQGVFEEGEAVLLADFESADRELAEVVTGALRIDLLQSPTIRLVERSELSEALRRMQLDGDDPITSDVAEELAAREGYGAVIEGEVRTAGSSYVLTARIASGGDGTTLAAFRETAGGDDELIDAIEDLSRSIRDKTGESLRSVQSAPALERVSTASLEALRVYTRAERLEDRGDRPGALELFERAAEIDPEFAMAHRKIGVLLGNMFVRRADQVSAIQRAYQLRERLPESERYLAEAFYHSQVAGDREAAARAYEALLEIDPESTDALNNVGNIYLDLGRIEEAVRLYERALSFDRYANGYLNLISAHELAGRFEEAHRTAARGVAGLPEAAFMFENLRIGVAFTAAEYGLADSLARAYDQRFGQPIARANATYHRYLLDALHGRLRTAERHIDDLVGAPAFFGDPVIHAQMRAGLQRQRGEASLAVRTLLGAFDRVRDSVPPANRGHAVAILSLLDAGDADAARSLHDEWTRDVLDEELGSRGRDDRRLLEATLAGLGGDVQGALRLIDQFERRCPGTCTTRAAFARARTFDRAGDGAAAARAYEAWLETPSNYRSFRDAQWRAEVLERLGRLYDELAEPDKAARYYGMFAEQWAGADDELQPRVRAARARLEEIARAGG